MLVLRASINYPQCLVNFVLREFGLFTLAEFTVKNNSTPIVYIL